MEREGRGRERQRTRWEQEAKGGEKHGKGGEGKRGENTNRKGKKGGWPASGLEHVPQTALVPRGGTVLESQ